MAFLKGFLRNLGLLLIIGIALFVLFPNQMVQVFQLYGALLGPVAILNLAHAQGVTCYKRTFCALSVGQMAQNLADIGQNIGHRMLFGPEFRPIAEETSVFRTKNQASGAA